MDPTVSTDQQCQLHPINVLKIRLELLNLGLVDGWAHVLTEQYVPRGSIQQFSGAQIHAVEHAASLLVIVDFPIHNYS